MIKLRRGGFTLAEMLLVVVILALLSAIAFGALTAYNASLTAKRLNSAAEELFLYAQNRLVYMQSLGSDDTVSLSLRGEGSYLLAGENCDESLVSHNIITSIGGKSAFIEVDLSSGDILAVFFSETLSPEELESEIQSLESCDLEELVEHRIGYYGAYEHSLSPREYMFEPEVVALNGEELVIEVTCRDIPDASLGDFSVYLTLSSDAYSEEMRLTDVGISDGALKASLLIDSITASGSSYYIDEYSPFFGDGILSAKAVIYCKGYGITSERTAQSRSVDFDPLYDSRDENAVRISGVRHLNNLRFLSDKMPAKVFQTCDLHFKDGFRMTPLTDFKGEYDGGDNSIYGLMLDGNSSENVGLFSLLSGSVKNLHIVGNGGNLLIDSDVAKSAGILCGKVGPSGEIVNCSVSGVDIECISRAGGDIFVGGLAGTSEGSIVRCSAGADISLSAPNAAFTAAGGLAGCQKSGEIEYSHSSGKIVMDCYGESAVAGIAFSGGGSIASCYSECSAGYISGAEYYGISNADCEGSYFVSENAWLAENRDSALPHDELAGLSGRGLAEPRGLIGLVRVEYSDGEFLSDLPSCFDAYGNNSSRRPNIAWSGPGEGEVRYYFFVSESAFPEGTAEGWECLISNKSAHMGIAESFDGFAARQIIDLSDGDNIILRFGNEERNTTVGLPETASEGILGAIGVIYRAYSIDFDFSTGEIIERQEHFDYYYGYIDPSEGRIVICDSDAPNETRIPELETLTFSASRDSEMRIYAFSSEELTPTVGSVWNFSSEFDDAPKDAGSVSGYRFYELYSGEGFSGTKYLKFVYEGRDLARFGFWCNEGLGGRTVVIRAE